MTNQSTKRPALKDSDSEWEYEYSQRDTETHYITLDLSSHSPNDHRKKRQRITKPTPALTTRQKAAKNNQATQTEAEAEAGADANETANEAGRATEAEQRTISELEAVLETAVEDGVGAKEGIGDAEAAESAAPSSKIQVLDLHTANPLVAYQGTIYSCTWTTPLGTDILLKLPKTLADAVDEGIVDVPNPNITANGGSGSARGADGEGGPVLAFSEIRLMAKPMTVVPRNDEDGAKEAAIRPRKEVVDIANETHVVDENGETAPSQQIPEETSAVPQQPIPHSPASAAQTPDATPSGAPPIQPSNSARVPAEPSLLAAALHPHSSQERIAQATFLERLIAAKRNLGETDEVTVFASKRNTGTGWRSRQKSDATKKLSARRENEENGEAILVEDDGPEDNAEMGEDRENVPEQNVLIPEQSPHTPERSIQMPSQRFQARKVREATTRVEPRAGHTARGPRGRRAGRHGGTGRVQWQGEGSAGHDGDVEMVVSSLLGGND